MNRVGLAIAISLMGLLLQGCESDGSIDPESGSRDDTLIEDIPVLADSFVLNTFALDENGEPLDIDGIELLKEE